MKIKNINRNRIRSVDKLHIISSLIIMLIMIMSQTIYASVRLPNTEYTESTTDMSVKVLGGSVRLNRTWENGRWYLNPAWAELHFKLDPLDSSVKTIDRAGTIYKRSGTSDLYTFHQVSIHKTEDGWRWTDKQGNWINYDSKGRPLNYGDANNVKVNFELDKDGRRKAIKDHNNELVYSLDYDNKEHLIKATDRSGRSVNYTWSGDNLTKVTDVLGNVWQYGYDKNGQISSRTEPDGGVTKIDYVLSVPSSAMYTMDSGSAGGSFSQSIVVSTDTSGNNKKLARVGKITAQTGAVTVYNTDYNRVNKQYTITVNDPLGVKTVNVYDSKGEKLSKTVNDELKERYESDTATNQVKIFDERGIATIVQKDSEDRPIKITAADGSTESYQYNSTGRLTKYVDIGGNVTEFQYNDQNNLTQIIRAKGKPEQHIISWEYDQLGQAKSLKTGEKQKINLQQTFDKYGNVASYTDGNGNIYQFTYNVQGQVTSVKTPNNNIWQLSYNAAGIPEQFIDPQGRITKYTSDALGRITQITDSMGNTTNYSYQYNSQGWQVKATNALNQTYTYNFDLVGNFINVILPSGLELKQSYDKQGRFKSQQDIAGNTTSIEYGAIGSGLDGLVVKALFPTYSEKYNYDSFGSLTSISQILDNNTSLTTSISYNEQKLPASITFPDGSTFMTRYDAYGNVVKDIDALGAETSSKWDELGNLSSIIDPAGHSYTFSYDNNGNLIKESESANNQTSYTYDKDNQLIAQKDANGNEVRYLYNQTGDLIEESHFKKNQADAVQRIIYSYNDIGQLTGVNQEGDTQSSFNYVLDKLGRKIKETITYQNNNKKITKTLQYSYDVDGNLSSITYPDNSVVKYLYTQGNLKEVALPNGEKIVWNSYLWNEPESITTPGSKTDITYTALQQPLSIQVINTDNKILLQRNYQYDKSGNIIQSKTEEGTTDYRYDILDRLTQVNPDQKLRQKGLSAEAYSYDSIDNRIGSVNQAEKWQYNSNNQLIQWGSGEQQTVLSYDESGNLINEQKANKNNNYQYDHINQLISIQDGEIEKAHYQYDPFGRRISKTVNGETTYYLYSDEGLLAEFDHNGKMQIAYGWMPDTVWGTSPLWQAGLSNEQTLKNADYNFLITDYLGTPQLAVNSRGQQTWKGIADAFGNTHLDPNNIITMNLRLPGQYYDQESGLYYNLNRYYNPQIGRYIGSDPLGIEGGLNLYNYAESNPLMNIDPYGLYSFPNFIDDTSNFSSGFGDGLTFDGTKWIRDKNGWGAVDDCSGLYKTGKVVGQVFQVVLGGIIFEKVVVPAAGTAINLVKRWRYKPKVTADLYVGGKRFRNWNQNARKAKRPESADPNKKTLIHEKIDKKNAKAAERGIDKVYPNGNGETAHAEIGAMNDAYEQGLTQGADAEMIVKGELLCTYCRSDVTEMAKKSGLNSLKIFAKNREGDRELYLWKAGWKKAKIKKLPPKK
ncbi:cytidine deaminase-like fold-containing protein [Snodgrassella alvi]|uniref:cytidine deaminase-like fold-containing protein n=1 Tax=Snodgrassella alvi TaxID=1196083 RepID=UPI003CFE3078